MIELLVVSLVLIALTVLIHAFGTLFLMRRLIRDWKTKWKKAPIWRQQILLVRIVCELFFLHLVEAAVWAVFYCRSGALANFHIAMYFSVCSYTTVGYGDVVLTDRWKLLGGFESCIGVLMLGWSTGIIIAFIARQFDEHFHPRQGI